MADDELFFVRDRQLEYPGFDVDNHAGSDFRHPEGMRDPLAFSEAIESLPLDTRKAVMGGNLEQLLADA
jgi:hypothetical protein